MPTIDASKSAGPQSAKSAPAGATAKSAPGTGPMAMITSLIKQMNYQQGAALVKPSAPAKAEPAKAAAPATGKAPGPQPAGVAKAATPPAPTVAKEAKAAEAKAKAAAAPPVALPGTTPKQTDGPTSGPPAMDREAAAKAAQDLHNSMARWGTDEAKLLGALRGRSPAEIDAIRAVYRDSYGKSLDAEIAGELGGKDLAEAKAAMSGDQAASATAALNNSVGVLNDDEAKIHDTLRNLTASDLARLKADPNGQKAIAKVRDKLGGADLAIADALLAGNKAKAQAIELDAAMRGMGTNVDKVQDILEGASDGDKAKILDEYKQFVESKGESSDLHARLKGEMSGGDLRMATMTLDHGKNGADAARMVNGSKAFFTDKKALTDTLEGKGDAEREQIAALFAKEYGGAESSLEAVLAKKLKGDQLEKAKQALTKGKVDDDLALDLAMAGVGTDESAIHKILDGKSKAEMATIKAAYARRTGRSLDADLDSELSGKDYFDAKQNAKGLPETPEEKLDRVNEAQKFEREGWRNALSKPFMDMGEAIGLHDTGAQMDAKAERARALFDANGKLIPGKEAELDALVLYHKLDTEDYEAAKEKAGEAAATVVEISIAVAATAASGGTLGPAAAMMIAGGSSVGGMVTRGALKGNSYGAGALGEDVVSGAASVATAGIMASKPAAKMLGKAGKLVTKATGGSKLAGKAVQSGLGETVDAASGAMATAAMDDDKWRQGGGAYAANILGTGAVSGAKALPGGIVGGAVEGSLTGPGRPTMGKHVRKKAATAAAKSTVDTLVEPETYNGTAVDAVTSVGENVAKDALKAAGTAALGKFVKDKTKGAGKPKPKPAGSAARPKKPAGHAAAQGTQATPAAPANIGG